MRLLCGASLFSVRIFCVGFRNTDPGIACQYQIKRKRTSRRHRGNCQCITDSTGCWLFRKLTSASKSSALAASASAITLSAARATARATPLPPGHAGSRFCLFALSLRRPHCHRRSSHLQGRRVAEGQRVIQPLSDLLPGWTPWAHTNTSSANSTTTRISGGNQKRQDQSCVRRDQSGAMSHAAQASRLQFVRPDHILVPNEIGKLRRTELHKRGQVTCTTD
jgi:hypothetical protein